MKRLPKVIAEIGCNHKGDLEIAKEMISVAANFCNADFVKFQKRTPSELLTPIQYAAPHPNQHHSYGASYGEHRENLELTKDQHRELAEEARKCGIGYSSSAWDLTSAKEIAELDPEFIKIPSAHNLNFPLLATLCDSYRGDLHISLGMTTISEADQIVDFLENKGRAKDTVLYSCTSGYPVANEDVCLLEIPKLQERYGKRVQQIGFSGHHQGFAIDVAAFTLGANWIERHFTLDRTWKGTDHAASLEPDGMRRLCRNLKAVAQALQPKDQEILEVEVTQRNKLKYLES